VPQTECGKLDERLRFVARLLDGEKMARGEQMKLSWSKRFWGCSRFPVCNGTRPEKQGRERAKQRPLSLDSKS